MLKWVVVAVAFMVPTTEASVTADRNDFVGITERSGGFYFMISGYAMNTTGQFNSTVAPSLCICRRRCDVDPSCHAVSMIPLTVGDAGGATECRTSTLPEVLTNKGSRPFLEATEGAFHILSTDAEDQKLPQYNDGMYYNRPANSKTWATAGCPLAVAKTPEQLEILKNELDQLPDSAGSKLYVGLRRDANGPLVWDFGSYTTPYTLDSSLIEDSLPLTSPAVFYLMKDLSTTEYKFVASDGTLPLRVLCQRNHLNFLF
ncbi:uncharacterized protein LOC122262442 [Penaeus japonicus]|uniref:uncharacterized protein LOC122262442 n=1 Tax=Penaeus japonicus TaxID=27405 RepID=UPI001C715437|nr:uncharacterized protein LOC122262442 [Penaeus japonicus]